MADPTRRRLPQLADVPEPEPIHKQEFHGGFRWWVFPHNRSHARHEMDVADFAEGNHDLDLSPRPELLAALAPAIAEWSTGKPEGSADKGIMALRSFWRFADTMAARTGGDVIRLADITTGLGQLFKGYLLRDLKLGPAAARKNLKLLQGFAERARALAGDPKPQLLWPSIRDKRGAVHKDVDPAQLRRLYTALKNIHRKQEALVSEGARLLERGCDPRQFSARSAAMVYGTGTSDGPKNPAKQQLDAAWRTPDNIAFLAKQFVSEALIGLYPLTRTHLPQWPSSCCIRAGTRTLF